MMYHNLVKLPKNYIIRILLSLISCLKIIVDMTRTSVFTLYVYVCTSDSK